ncbi:MAG: amino acid permease, partial [Candidatus Marinimicrobia bacterium]|nr:amino acid permease [Candidatus Neomarinimicrobiota bacterium]
MMGLGMMIGAGVFLGIGNAIYYSGPGGVVLTFALNGVIAIFTAMSYAELSSAIPRAGGAYNFARIGFGRGTSFIAGWMEWFASSVAGSAYAITFAIYIWRYIQGVGLLNDVGVNIFFIEKITAVIIAVIFIYINYRGASETGKIGAFFTLGQTIFLIFIGIVGFIVVIKDPSRLQNFQPFMPRGWAKLFVTMGFTYVAFEGFEVIAQAGDEAIMPKKNLPKAMIYSVFIVTLTYVAVAFATVVAVKAGSPGVGGEVWQWIGSYHEKGFGEAIGRLMPYANFLLTLAVIFASTSALNATIFSATRASYALGRDHMLPGTMAKISKKRKTPWVALLFTGAIIIFVAVFLNTMDVASSASIMFLFLFFLVNLCVIVIRRNMADELEYGFMMPFFPLLPVVAIICQAILAINLHEVSYKAWIIGPSWIIAGIMIYLFYSKSHAITTEDEILVIEDEKASEEVGYNYNIMIAVANPENALGLVRNSYKLCGAKNAQVELLHMIPVPQQVPLSDASQYMIEGKESVIEMMIYLEPLFPVSTTLRYCRSIARGIVSAVREKKVDMLIMGWHGKPKNQEFSLGSTIDPIIERSPCSVVILKDCGNRTFKKIFVPLSGGPNCGFALEVATILAEKEHSQIVAFNVESENYTFDIDAFVKRMEPRLKHYSGDIALKKVKAKNVERAILKEAQHYDLVVIGTTQQPLISQFLKISLPEVIAQKCNKPVAIVKASGGIRSWV